MRKISVRFIVSLLLLAVATGVSTAAAQTIPAPAQRKPYSVLSLGTTLKVAVKTNGIYRITYEDLSSQGLLSQPVANEKLAVYGNISGPLPFYNTDDIYDDVNSLPLYIYDANSDGLFGNGDYLCFYGESPHRFSYNSAQDSLRTFSFNRNPFSDYTRYFVGINAEYPARPESTTPDDGSSPIPYTELGTFAEYTLHENDLYNLCEGGMDWLGEKFPSSGSNTAVTLSATGNAAAQTSKLYLKTAVATSSASSDFYVSAGGVSQTVNHPVVNSDLCAGFKETTIEIPLSGSSLRVNLTYNKPSGAGDGYLDRAILFYDRPLSLGAGSLNFREPKSINKNALFRICSPQSGLKIWDVSNVYAVKEIETETASSGSTVTYSFHTRPDATLHEYVAFTPATCPKPSFEGLVQAQNLHGIRNIDYVIVTHPNFLAQAEKIANFHAEHDAYSVLTVTTQQVYNEFSSGSKDPSALRLLMRHLWKMSDSVRRPLYLCLMGAASYDYKNILGEETDYVPTLQYYGNAAESAGDPLEDNLAYLEDNEGISPYNKIRKGQMDIAVGRLPVHNTGEAESVYEKIDIYSSTKAFGDWRSEVVLVTDDSFESDMEASVLKNNDYPQTHPEYHLNKLYSDAYLRASTSTSTRIPEMEKALKKRIEKGSLFIGYLGHSGWDAWSDEKVLTLSIIESLAPSVSYPIMTASSCSFAIFDNPQTVSGAERLVLLPHAGAIAVMGTTRTAHKYDIEDVHSRFLYALSTKPAKNDSRPAPTIGSAYLTAKVNNNQHNGQKFILLGDPGLRVALPKYNVQTLKINGHAVDSGGYTPDTVKALDLITVEGCLTGPQGEILNGFNGEIIAKVYDKPIVSHTLGVYNSREHTHNEIVPYTQQNSLIFQGVSSVENGHFSFSFIVPKDIQYNYDFGKILYYAYCDSADANGVYNKLLVGGFNGDVVLEPSVPNIRLRIGGPNSLGTQVGLRPTLYAEISDQYGINTTGSGIGHDMELVIDGNESDVIVVNSLFQYDFGSYKSGTLAYELGNLTPGGHTARLKVWNINNISATATIAFSVNADGETQIYDLVVAPNPNSGDYADFYFTHNGEAGHITECDIQIFDLFGKHIADMHYDLKGVGNHVNGGHAIGPLRWDMAKSRAGKLQAGIYICRIMASGSEGKKVCQTTKLVVF